jgi:hypothetical protein
MDGQFSAPHRSSMAAPAVRSANDRIAAESRPSSGLGCAGAGATLPSLSAELKEAAMRWRIVLLAACWLALSTHADADSRTRPAEHRVGGAPAGAV